MNIRLCWLDDLVTHLKTDANLTEIGKYVIPMSHYRGITTTNQFSPSIWIIPQDGNRSGSSGNKYSPDCSTMITSKILVCTVVKNVIACLDHVGHEIIAPNTTEVYGAYIEAAEIEKKLRQSMMTFNKIVSDDPIKYKYSALELVSLPEPDEHNGHFILGQIYQTTFNF